MAKFIVEDYNVTDESDLDSLASDERDSDVELQEALLTGQLKPGLHAQLPFKPKVEINNTNALKSKLSDFELDANWVERLDLAGDLNELPDHVPNPLKGQATSQESNDLDVVRNDIKREIKFMLQAKSAVLQGLARLHALKVKTKRPDDYLAEMLKSKEHMDKIKKVKETKKEQVEKKEKSKLLREQKKMGKKIQQEVLKDRQKQKKEFQEKIRRYRKGDKSVDFLDENKGRQGGGGGPQSRQLKQKQQRNPKLTKKEFKQSKFGYGGRKKGLKKNTAESSAQFTGFKRSKGFKKDKRTKRK